MNIIYYNSFFRKLIILLKNIQINMNSYRMSAKNINDFCFNLFEASY